MRIYLHVLYKRHLTYPLKRIYAAGMATDLLTDIRSFLTKSGMGPSYFGKVACGNSEVVDRLEAGGTVTLVTAERIREFIESKSTGPSSEPERAPAA